MPSGGGGETIFGPSSFLNNPSGLPLYSIRVDWNTSVGTSITGVLFNSYKKTTINSNEFLLCTYVQGNANDGYSYSISENHYLGYYNSYGNSSNLILPSQWYKTAILRNGFPSIIVQMAPHASPTYIYLATRVFNFISAFPRLNLSNSGVLDQKIEIDDIVTSSDLSTDPLGTSLTFVSAPGTSSASRCLHIYPGSSEYEKFTVDLTGSNESFSRGYCSTTAPSYIGFKSNNNIIMWIKPRSYGADYGYTIVWLSNFFDFSTLFPNMYP